MRGSSIKWNWSYTLRKICWLQDVAFNTAPKMPSIFSLEGFWRTSWSPKFRLVWSCPNYWLAVLTLWFGDAKKLSGNMVPENTQMPILPFEDPFSKSIWIFLQWCQLKKYVLFLRPFERETYYFQSVSSCLLFLKAQFFFSHQDMIWMDGLENMWGFLSSSFL